MVQASGEQTGPQSGGWSQGTCASEATDRACLELGGKGLSDRLDCSLGQLVLMQQLTEEPLRVLSRGQHMKGSAVGAASAGVQDGPKHGDLEEEMGIH